MNQKGFTLIEALVALVILSTALVPLFYFFNQTVNAAFIISSDLTGANLAQEGIEVIRNMRDTNWHNSLAFDTNITAGTFRIQWDSTTLLPSAGNPVLKINNGLYNYSSGTDSIFSRSIVITKIGSIELKIVSQVSWPVRGGTKTIQVEEHLFDWK
ncbi:type II secretion system GspH family protein [Candidatus Parcubacteria bacterium]|nr:type II secretion system GspH family protein [Candidatus Parcubacteria bacterium]